MQIPSPPRYPSKMTEKSRYLGGGEPVSPPPEGMPKTHTTNKQAQNIPNCAIRKWHLTCTSNVKPNAIDKAMRTFETLRWS